MIRSILYGVVLIFASVVSAQSPPNLGAAIQTTHRDPATNIVTIRIVNTSQKDITAFNLSLTLTYPNNQITKYQHSRDFLDAGIVLDGLRGKPNEQDFIREYGDGRIPAGGFYDEKITVNPGIINFEAVLDMVAFGDKTAEATNTDAFHQLVDQRKASAATLQKTNEIIRKVASDPTEWAAVNHRQAAADQVEKAMNAWKDTPHNSFPDLSEMEFTRVIRELRRTQSDAKENLNTLMDAKEKERARWADQAQLKIGGQQ